LTAPAGPGPIGNYVMASEQNLDELRKCKEIDFSARSDGVMIRPREKRNRRPRRARRHEALHDRRDEPLRLLARILARQAARERFERQAEAEQDAPPGVTLH
jgi:hypothetical protein